MPMWNEYCVADVVSKVIDYRGKTPKKLGGDWSDKGYRALSAKNIKTGEIVQQDNIRYVPENMYHKWMKEEIQRGDIIITSEAPFGQVYYWDSDEKIVLSQRLFAVRINDKFYPKYIYFYMTSPRFQAELAGRATGTTVIGLRQPELMKCKIFAPNYEDQKQIADILWSLENKINVNNRINQNLEQQVQALFKAWFVNFEPFEGAKPQNWPYVTFGDVCHNIRTKTNDNDHVVLSAVSTGELQPSSDFFSKQVFSKDLSNYLTVPKKTFAYNPARVNIGSIGLNMFDYEGCVSPVYVVFSVNSGYEAYFNYLIKTPSFREEVKMRASGSVRQTLNYKDLALIELIYPDEITANKFNDFFWFIQQKKSQISKETDTLIQTRDTLLPKLMSGELDVSTLDI